MAKHCLGRLIGLIDTAYYNQDDNKAVCEVLGHENGRVQISLFVNGTQIENEPDTLQNVLTKHHLDGGSWTTKPQ